MQHKTKEEKEQINSTFVSYDCEFIEDRIYITGLNFENLL